MESFVRKEKWTLPRVRFSSRTYLRHSRRHRPCTSNVPHTFMLVNTQEELMDRFSSRRHKPTIMERLLSDESLCVRDLDSVCGIYGLGETQK